MVQKTHTHAERKLCLFVLRGDVRYGALMRGDSKQEGTFCWIHAKIEVIYGWFATSLTDCRPSGCHKRLVAACFHKLMQMHRLWVKPILQMEKDVSICRCIIANGSSSFYFLWLLSICWIRIRFYIIFTVWSWYRI